jgi:hypothetical protein
MNTVDDPGTSGDTTSLMSAAFQKVKYSAAVVPVRLL